MATGDNILTAISVGKQCNIIPDTEDVFLADVKDIQGQEKMFWRITSGEDLDQEESATKDLADFPWLNPPSKYSIAITGKAFFWLLRNPEK